MRLKDFMVVNDIRDQATATQINELCSQAHRKEVFGSVNLAQLAMVKESVVRKDKTFRKKVVATAYQKLSEADDHLFAAYVDAQNKKHAKTLEAVAMFRAEWQGEKKEIATPVVETTA